MALYLSSFTKLYIMKHLFVAVMVMMVSVAAFGQEVRNPSFTRGFAGNVEAGVLFKDGFAGEYVNVSSGYNILPGVFAGVGIGIKNQKFHSLSDVNSFLVYYCPLKLFDSTKN